MAVATRNAEDIKKAVVDELYWDARVNAADVQVEVADNRVTLTGTVPSLGSRQAADEDAWLIEGVNQVDNQLDVKVTGIEPPSDETIAARVADTLLWHPDIDSSEITQAADAGWVRLKGSVGSYWQKILAEEVVSSLGGVLGVQNELAVVPSRDITDQSIADAIVSAMERNSYVDPEQVNVRVDNAVVTLSGQVPNLTAYRAAYDTARYTVGVINVKNELTFA